MKPVRAFSMVAHGICWGLPQALTSVTLLETILFCATRGSQPLNTSLSAFPLLCTLFAWVVDPHRRKGDWAIELPLKNTSFHLLFSAVLSSKKWKVVNFIPSIQELVPSKYIPASPHVEEEVNLLLMN